MATTSPTAAYLPSEKSQAAVLAFYKQAYGLLNSQWEIRGLLKSIDLSYLRETDWTAEQYKAKMANRRGDSTKFQNVVIPVVMPQVESAVTYQQSVFLQGYPIFSAVSIPGLEDAALQMDTIIGEQQIEFNWIGEIQQTLRNAFKYNLAAAEVDWVRKTTYALETSTDYQGGAQGKPKQVIRQGNAIKNLDMYNIFFDTRCKPTDIPEYGEFAGYNEMMSRVRLKKFLEELPYRINVTKAFESSCGGVSLDGSSGVEAYYVPQLNPEALLKYAGFGTGTDWMAWAGMNEQVPNIQYKNMFQVTTLYARILPSDFKFERVPGPNIPQVWKFIIVNNQVIVYCERLTNAHNLIPIIFMQAYEDGLGYQTKSLASNVQPIQEITTALANSSIASRRRAIADRMLFDPSRISPAAINNDNPISKIPVRPSAYGTAIGEAVYQIPFRDDQFQVNAAEMQMYGQMANQISGFNAARQGQFVKGNKTKFEYADIMANANGRDQTVSLSLEGSFFSKVKTIVKNNILQFQGNETLYNRELGATVTVDPVLLRKASTVFTLADGLLPSDKLIDGESLGLAFQAMAGNPQIGASYNLGPMFSYLMKSRGARLAAFEKSPEQVAYEQAVGEWQSAVAMLAEQLAKVNPPMSPEDIQKSIPPQPTPEQFGFDPKTTGMGQVGKKGSIIQQVGSVLNPQGAQ